MENMKKFLSKINLKYAVFSIAIVLILILLIVFFNTKKNLKKEDCVHLLETMKNNDCTYVYKGYEKGLESYLFYCVDDNNNVGRKYMVNVKSGEIYDYQTASESQERQN